MQSRKRVLKHVLGAVAVIGAVVLCIVAGQWFLATWRSPPEIVGACEDRTGFHELAQSPDPFYRCRDVYAEKFLRLDFAETKDLCKAFLTLLTALLVASITFSEKIVDLNRASWWPRGLMIACWTLLLIAIAASGAALALMTAAAGWAAYSPERDFLTIELKAAAVLIAGGLAFGGALVTLFVAGALSLLEREHAAATRV